MTCALSGKENPLCGRGGRCVLRGISGHNMGAATCRGEVAGGACWHALCQAMEITLVVAAAGTARGEVAGGA